MVGARMSEFAVGSLAVIADLNPKYLDKALFPFLATNLPLIPLVASVAVVHLILVIMMLWIARSVVVSDNSNLCTAHLLQSLVGRLEGNGSLLDSKEMAEAISSQGTGQVVYGIRDMVKKGEGRVLELAEIVQVQEKWRMFPGGMYA
ncbi:hypothetical protein MMC22_001627 [Lobaria immixta]|nr:hypothetical protein [Lobaria immixta]